PGYDAAGARGHQRAAGLPRRATGVREDPGAPWPITIRRARSKDAETLLELIRALAEYERLEPPDAEAAARLIELAFEPHPRFEGYLVSIDAREGGYAIVFETYSTFLARPSMYVEDLFVRPGARRQGAATALL